MVEATLEGVDRAPGLPLPPELRQDWPVPWQPVLGRRGGFLAGLECALVRSLLAGAARLPIGLADAGIGVLARAARRLDRRHTRAARTFLTQALGELPEGELDRRVLEAYAHFFRVVLGGERFRLRVPPERTLDAIELDLAPEVEALRHSGRGCVLVTGHLGDWEVAAAAMPWLGFDPFYGIAKPIQNRAMSRAVQRERERRGVRLLPRRGAMKHAAGVIAAGGALGMLLDQRARQRPVLAPVFGRLARCDRTAAVLLRRLRAPVIVGACYLAEEPLRYRLVVPTLLDPEELASTSAEELVGRINRELEALIRRAPGQYFWLHDRYRGAPPPGASAEGEGEADLPASSADEPTADV